MARPLSTRLLEHQRRFWLEELAPVHGVERTLVYLLLIAAALHSPSSPISGVACYPSLRRVLMPETKNHIYFRVEGNPRGRGPKL